ncbi:MAG: hypothetical protein HY815_09025 [Candidatus Riflebacteria bacterium]|nr:hypothetical protein [Candidatus Riflebacteria bacterium]
MNNSTPPVVAVLSLLVLLSAALRVSAGGPPSGEPQGQQSETPEEFRPDVRLVRAFGPGVGQGLPDLPFCAQFQKWGKKLSFVATIHGTDKGTFSLVRQEIQLLKPQLVIKESSEVVGPNAANDALVPQRVSAENGLIRDIHLVQVIAQMLNRNDRVVVVYGGGHFQTDQACLERMLGRPRFIRPR